MQTNVGTSSTTLHARSVELHCDFNAGGVNRAIHTEVSKHALLLAANVKIVICLDYGKTALRSLG